jgi:hypothetical protein
MAVFDNQFLFKFFNLLFANLSQFLVHVFAGNEDRFKEFWI